MPADFGAGNQVYVAGAQSGFNQIGDLSLGFWLKLNSGSNGTFAQYGANTENEADNANWFLFLAGASNSWDVTWIHEFGAGTNETNTFLTNILNDKWCYLGFSKDATAKTVKCYVGYGDSLSLIATWNYTNEATGGNGANVRLSLGGREDLSQAFNSLMGPFFYHSRALSENEHTQQMLGDRPVDNSLIGYCPMTGIGTTEPNLTRLGGTYVCALNRTNFFDGPPVDYTSEFFETDGEVSTTGNNTQTLTGANGIASGEAFGAGGNVQSDIISGVTGIASGEAFGAGGSVTGPIVGTTGIASAEAFGTGTVGTAIASGSGIPSEEAFGSGGTVSPAAGGNIGGGADVGIPSAEAFGTPGVLTIIGSTGIPSAEAFGTGSLVQLIQGVTGIPSGEIFPSTGSLNRGIAGIVGIPSAEKFGAYGTLINFDPTNSQFTTTIGGVIRNGYVKTGSIKVERQLNFQASASFEGFDEAGTFFPTIGQRVQIWRYITSSGLWKKIFGGSIESIDTSKVPFASEAKNLATQIVCVDLARTMSKRVLTMKYPQAEFGTLTRIMTHINDTLLRGEGITWINQGDPGVTIPDIEFNNTRLNEVLDRLVVDICEREWQVDWDGNLLTFDRPAIITAAPFNISQTSDNAREFSVKDNRGLYRNRQIIKANFSQTTSVITTTYTNPVNKPSPPNEFFVYYDGTLLNDVEYFGRVNRILEIKVDSVSVPFFLQGQTAPPGWKYMQIFERELQLIWNLPGFPSAPGAGAVLEVTFEVTNALPEPVVVENASEIAARSAIEGTSGVYEDVFEVSDIEDRDTLIGIAQKLLDRFAVMGKEVDYQTDEFGIEPGQSQTIDLPNYGHPSASRIIESITSYEVDGDARTLWRSDVKASNSIQQRDALTAMHRLIKKLRKPANRNKKTVKFTLAETIPGQTNPGLQTGTNMTTVIVLRESMTLIDVVVYFKTAPTGQAIIINIRANGTSIFPVATLPTFPAGGTAIVTHTQFATPPLTLPKDTILTIDVTQVGSIEPGKDGTVEVNGWV